MFLVGFLCVFGWFGDPWDLLKPTGPQTTQIHTILFSKTTPKPSPNTPKAPRGMVLGWFCWLSKGFGTSWVSRVGPLASPRAADCSQSDVSTRSASCRWSRGETLSQVSEIERTDLRRRVHGRELSLKKTWYSRGSPKEAALNTCVPLPRGSSA